VKKLLSALGTIVVVGGLLAFGALRYWNVFGQAKLGGSCASRAGCRSFWCLAHARRGPVEEKVAGYCTDKCDTDADCAEAGLKCVVPTPEALDDLAKLGRPAKLCERVD
jgi:hypothetical protein